MSLSVASLVGHASCDSWANEVSADLPVVKGPFLFLVSGWGGTWKLCPAVFPSMTWAGFCHFYQLCQEACCVPSAGELFCPRHIWSMGSLLGVAGHLFTQSLINGHKDCPLISCYYERHCRGCPPHLSRHTCSRSIASLRPEG